jgi:cytosine/adenosine deaminase-related metal-dependent hydrolase
LLKATADGEERVKSRDEIMDSGSARPYGVVLDAGELAKCSHHTVAQSVERRDRGELPDGGPVRPERLIDPLLPTIEEWVERSDGKIRADLAFDKLKLLGFEGPERTVRRTVAEVKAKANYRRGRRWVYRPWMSRARGRSGTGAPVRASAPGRGGSLRVAGLAPVPGGDPDRRPHDAHIDRLPGPGHADLRRGADVLARRKCSRGTFSGITLANTPSKKHHATSQPVARSENPPALTGAYGWQSPGRPTINDDPAIGMSWSPMSTCPIGWSMTATRLAGHVQRLPPAEDLGAVGGILQPDVTGCRLQDGGGRIMAIDGRNDAYVLTGRVVTMDRRRQVIDDGALYIRQGEIVGVRRVTDARPAGFEGAPRIDTGDTLYPGMIELHNHLAYNAVPLWRVPKLYEHNGSWRGTEEAKRGVSKPAEVLARTPGVVEALVRYAECRCLLGGVTTSQGITLSTRQGIQGFFKGLVRNVEQSLVPGLPSAETRIADPETGKAQAYLDDLQAMTCRLQHLSEGVGETPRGWFLRLRLPNGAWAITDAFCGIHATALTRGDFDAIRERGGSVVWSPLSNLLLYGATTDLQALKDAQVLLGLGSDWSPSGSKNLLGELKVAWVVSQEAGRGNAVFSPAELVAMATINPARICKWDGLLGSLEENKLADIVGINGLSGDPYLQVLEARESSITLVVIDGVPRAGQRRLMERFAPIGGAHEEIAVGGSARSLDLAPPAGVDPLGGITLTDAKHRLRDALADLPSLAADLDSGLLDEGFVADFGVVLDQPPPLDTATLDETPRWVVKLDFAGMDDALTEAHGVFDTGSLADWVEPMAFEDLTVADDPGFLTAIVNALNVPRFVKEGLPPLYGRTIGLPSDAAVPLHPAIRTELGEVGDLAMFLDGAAGQLTVDDRIRIVDQAVAMLENHYAHLPLKRARYAVDPVQRLRVLRRDLDAASHPLPPEIEFHAELLDTFASLRDLHTAYQLPFPFRSRVAWLPFLVEEGTDNGSTRHLVTKLVQGFDLGALSVGAEVLHWNGTPIAAAIRQLERFQPGSNPAARHARAAAALTIRPLGHMVAPPEEWTVVHFRPSNEDYVDELRLRWLVSTPRRGIGRIELDELGLGATELGVDSQIDELNNVRKIFFAGPVLSEERRAHAEGRPLEATTREGEIATSLPTVIRARQIPSNGVQYGYLRIFSFNVADVDGFIGECRRLLEEELPPSGLVLDVRGNGGGSIVAAESLLELLSPEPIEPEHAQFLATGANLRLCQRHAQSTQFPGLELEPWRSSIDDAIGTGAAYSLGFPITATARLRSLNQAYPGPKVLVVDPLCYSATDIFAAGFADHGIGKILGVGRTTGAGGANVWSHRILQALFQPDDPTADASPYEQLPFGSDLRVAIRRMLRVRGHAGEIVEDFGVVPDRLQALTVNDVLNSNEDLLAAAAALLREQTHRSLELGVTGEPNAGPILTVTAIGVERVDVRVNGWHLRSTPISDAPVRIHLGEYQGPHRDPLDVDVAGISDGHVVVRRRISVPDRQSPR